ncbi:MAG: phosphoenolpyruvate carboxykinase (ATP) [Candidatus Gastranaerophilaceae bacterium]
MATLEFFTDSDELKSITSAARATIMAPFFGNNVKVVKDVEEAYNLSKNSPGTVELTGMPVFKPEKLGLPRGANQLLFNDGAVVGRCAAARKIVGEPNCDIAALLPIIREAVYQTRSKLMYKSEVVVGLDKDFMIKAHLLIPKPFVNNLYSWMLNFQYITKTYENMYKKSRKINEGDIYVFSDPDWTHPDFPYGLTFFDPKHNCAAILGMRYFGEHKKGTLTLAWGAAARNGYASCHGGMKKYNLGKKSFQAAVFGLSGSGKSTITHAKGKYDVTVLHDDAFIINVKDKYSIALEPAYFDKTQDYPIECEDNKYIITQQNNGVIQGKDGKLYSITEDVRNGNGRAVKSKLWSPNRLDRIDEAINAIFWLMKDPAIPPVIKLLGPSLGAAMGATLATKRTSAERLPDGVDANALVFEPYANPFRVYPLEMDYTRFKKLFEDGVDCYVLNTGDFMGKKIQPKDTLGIIEAIAEGSAKFEKSGDFSDIQTMHVEGFVADFNDKEYAKEFKKSMTDRIDFVKSREKEKAGLDKLPPDAIDALQNVVKQIVI